jgi:GMP synthase-like glutamine amidotransferase
VYEEGAPHVSKEIWEMIKEREIPVLGICYGMQVSFYKGLSICLSERD